MNMGCLDWISSYVFSCSFNSFCMKIIGDFLSLSVLANWTLNVSGFLVCIICFFRFLGNISTVLGFLVHFIANCRHNSSLLSSSVRRSNFFKAFLYPWYFSLSIILHADFCTLSRSWIFSLDRELCQTVADCSSRLLIKRMYTVFKSSRGAPNPATFLRSSILALAFLTISSVLRFHLRSLEMTVPSNFVWSITSTVCLFNCNLVVNWYFSVKLNNMVLVFSLINLHLLIDSPIIDHVQPFLRFQMTWGNYLVVCRYITRNRLLEIEGRNPNGEKIDDLKHCEIINKLESILITDTVWTIVWLGKIFQNPQCGSLGSSTFNMSGNRSAAMPLDWHLPVLEITDQDRD